jgi:hypothetical protein
MDRLGTAVRSRARRVLAVDECVLWPFQAADIRHQIS